MTYCKDCKYVKQANSDDVRTQWQFALCMHPARCKEEPDSMVHPMFSPVTTYCSSTRMKGGICGPDAKLFEVADVK